MTTSHFFRSARHEELCRFAPGVIVGYRLTRLQRLGRFVRSLFLGGSK